MDTSRVRERIKNIILFHNGTKFDPNDPVDVDTAQKIAGNAVICLSDLVAVSKESPAVLSASLKTDAVWWNPNPEDIKE